MTSPSPFPVPPPPPPQAPAGGSWRSANVALTIVAAILLALGLVGLVVLGVFAFLSGSICGMSCDAAQTLVGRVWWALAIGGGLSLVSAVASLVWRRWSSVILGVGVLIVIATALLMMSIMSTPLSEV